MSDPTGSAGRGRLAEVLATRGGRAEPEAPFVIEHREALIYHVPGRAGSSTDHVPVPVRGVLAQARGRRARAGGTRSRHSLAGAIAHVATEEMLHLALVQNVLSRSARRRT